MIEEINSKIDMYILNEDSFAYLYNDLSTKTTLDFRKLVTSYNRLHINSFELFTPMSLQIGNTTNILLHQLYDDKDNLYNFKK